MIDRHKKCFYRNPMELKRNFFLQHGNFSPAAANHPPPPGEIAGIAPPSSRRQSGRGRGRLEKRFPVRNWPIECRRPSPNNTGTAKFGGQCPLAHRRVECGVHFVEVDHMGWEHHDEFKASMDQSSCSTLTNTSRESEPLPTYCPITGAVSL